MRDAVFLYSTLVDKVAQEAEQQAKDKIPRRRDKDAEKHNDNQRPHTATSICLPQSIHRMRTSFVALTLMPQSGQMYLRVLDDFGGAPFGVPLCVPVPVI